MKKAKYKTAPPQVLGQDTEDIVYSSNIPGEMYTNVNSTRWPWEGIMALQGAGLGDFFTVYGTFLIKGKKEGRKGGREGRERRKKVKGRKETQKEERRENKIK